MLPGMLCIMYSQARATGEREQSITGNSNLSSHNSLSSNNIYPFLCVCRIIILLQGIHNSSKAIH